MHLAASLCLARCLSPSPTTAASTLDAARQPPQRIVTLLPSLTETVCELGACDRLVGVDDYSNWPAPVRALPHVGGLEDASIERIVALKPDLVLLSDLLARAARGWKALGLQVLALEPKTLADVQRVLGSSGRCWHVPARRARLARIERGIDAAARSAAARGARHHACTSRSSSGPYAASEVVLHRRTAHAPGRAPTSCRPAWAPFPSSIRSSWCAPIRR